MAFDPKKAKANRDHLDLLAQRAQKNQQSNTQEKKESQDTSHSTLQELDKLSAELPDVPTKETLEVAQEVVMQPTASLKKEEKTKTKKKTKEELPERLDLTTPVTLTLKRGIWKDCRLIARSYDMSLSEYVTRILESHLKKNQEILNELKKADTGNQTLKF